MGVQEQDQLWGGETTKARQGHEFYARIGKKGGESNRARPSQSDR